MLDSGAILTRGPRSARRNSRRRKLLRRGLPIFVLAVLAFGAGAFLATAPGRAERHTVSRYVDAWQHHDYAQMYSLLDRASRARTSQARFERELAQDAATATLISLTPTHVSDRSGGSISVNVNLDTRIWGHLRETLLVPLTGTGSGAHVQLRPWLLFPGLRPGERLSRTMRLAPRATLLASDGTPLAQGPQRTSPIPDVALQVVGTLGPISRGEAMRYSRAGYPPDARVGLDGLERVFQSRLAGTPGGTLLAGRRVLATAKPIQGHPVQSTISPSVEKATIVAMGNSYAGLVVMNPRTGAVLALGGIAYSAPQPPGSTMKIITAAAALQAGIAKLTSDYPIATSADIEGYSLQNANGESCGGSLLNAFAVSCNSVFAPLGARLGGQRLVAMAQRFGFDQPTGIPGAAESTIPSAATIGGALAVGSSAIGQGKVLSTPLGMADVAATIAMGGRRPIPTLLAHEPPRFVRVISPRVAHEVQRMMIAVVQSGTGTAGQIPGVLVAGKTGTAELTDTASSSNPSAGSPQNTDAWFVAYAPVGHPRFVAGALYPNQGFGGAAAAPPVQQILSSALRH